VFYFVHSQAFEGFPIGLNLYSLFKNNVIIFHFFNISIFVNHLLNSNMVVLKLLKLSNQPFIDESKCCFIAIPANQLSLLHKPKYTQLVRSSCNKEVRIAGLFLIVCSFGYFIENFVIVAHTVFQL
jgi:hypothetical protein